MKTIYKIVRSDGKEVGIAEGKKYETTAEATSDLGDEKVLDLVNTQDLTNRMNTIRSAYNAKPSQENLMKEAMKQFGELPPEEMIKAAQGDGGMQGWLDRTIKGLTAGFDSNKERMVAECAKKKAELLASGAEIIGADKD